MTFWGILHVICHDSDFMIWSHRPCKQHPTLKYILQVKNTQIPPISHWYTYEKIYTYKYIYKVSRHSPNSTQVFKWIFLLISPYNHNEQKPNLIKVCHHCLIFTQHLFFSTRTRIILRNTWHQWFGVKKVGRWCFLWKAGDFQVPAVNFQGCTWIFFCPELNEWKSWPFRSC